MKSRQLIHQARLSEWASIISEQQASGLTIRAWCAQNNVSLNKYHYWKSLLRDEYVQQSLPDIVSITLPTVENNPITSYTSNTTCTTINLSINGLDFSFNSSIPEEFLSTLIKAVRNA